MRINTGRSPRMVLRFYAAGRAGGSTLAATRLDAPDEPRDTSEPEFAAIDAVLARSSQALAAAAERDPLIFDPDWDEDARLADWQQILADTSKHPPLLAAALAWDAWETIAPLQHRPWLGPLLVPRFCAHAPKPAPIWPASISGCARLRGSAAAPLIRPPG